MLDLATLQKLNHQAAFRYLKTTPPRDRLLRRLLALELTTESQNERILAALDILNRPGEQEAFANQPVDELKKCSSKQTAAA